MLHVFTDRVRPSSRTFLTTTLSRCFGETFCVRRRRRRRRRRRGARASWPSVCETRPPNARARAARARPNIGYRRRGGGPTFTTVRLCPPPPLARAPVIVRPGRYETPPPAVRIYIILANPTDVLTMSIEFDTGMIRKQIFYSKTIVFIILKRYDTLNLYFLRL